MSCSGRRRKILKKPYKKKTLMEFWMDIKNTGNVEQFSRRARDGTVPHDSRHASTFSVPPQ